MKSDFIRRSYYEPTPLRNLATEFELLSLGWPEETSRSTRRYLLNQSACIFLNEADSTRNLDLRFEFNHKLQLSYLDMLKLKQDLEELTGTQVDLLEEKAVRIPLRRKRIIDERVLLYAS